MDLYENFATDVSVIKEELVKFWKSSPLRIWMQNFFFKNSSAFPKDIFSHNLAYISREIDRIFMKVLSQIYPCTRKSPLNFGGNSDPIQTPDPGQILVGRDIRSLLLLLLSLSSGVRSCAHI